MFLQILNQEYLANKLTKKIEIKFKVIHGNPLRNMKLFLKYVDKFNVIYKSDSPCKKGCSKCCYMDVAISELEISLIEKYVLKKKLNIIKNKDVIDCIIKREAEEGNKFGKLSKGERCPFLCNNKCLIYRIRPFFCRTFIIFENDNTKCGYIDGNSKRWNNQKFEYIYNKIIAFSLKRDYIPSLYHELYEIHDCFNVNN